MNTTHTVARTQTNADAHWYTRTGEPMHWVTKKNGDGTRATTIADARKQGLLPSPTSILKILNKPGLNNWIQEQVALTVLTAPRLSGEPLDAFVKRVLQEEKQHEAEASQARDIGTRIHEALEQACHDQPYDEELSVYVNPALEIIRSYGIVRDTERILVGDGYAGKVDLVLENDQFIWVVDFKTTKALPKEQWPEHKLQLAAYAKALGNTGDKMIAIANLYISKETPGAVAWLPTITWESWWEGFRSLQTVWELLNNYYPTKQ